MCLYSKFYLPVDLISSLIKFQLITCKQHAMSIMIFLHYLVHADVNHIMGSGFPFSSSPNIMCHVYILLSLYAAMYTC